MRLKNRLENYKVKVIKTIEEKIKKINEITKTIESEDKMNKKLKVLFAGESIYVQKLIYKGFDNFSIGSYVEHAEHYLNALRDNGIEVDYIPTNKVGEEFPWTLEELKNYDVVVVSDVEGNYEI